MGQALTILFVDDDRAIRRVVAEDLAARGFRVLTTDDGYEAMRLLAQEHVDVLFCDLVMPDIDGVQLVKQARLLRPDLQVLMATGYASKAREAESLGKLLFKPLRADQIESEIRQLLSEGGSLV
jgi:DNA-binding NtrC family response regulator